MKNYVSTDQLSNFTSEELQEFAQAFKVNVYFFANFITQIFDKNSDGIMSTRELGIAMRTMGLNPTEKELLDIIYEFDEDDNGSIDFTEWCHIMKMMNKETDRELIQLAFRLMIIRRFYSKKTRF
jgi:calmodulin